MTIARAQLVDTSLNALVPLHPQRCVRRAFLLGEGG